MEGEKVKKRKESGKMSGRCARSGKRKIQGVNRARKKSSVPRSVELALVREAFGSLECIKASFSPTDELSCV